MIILRLRGGLGNQLFEYAAGCALATYHNVSLKIDDYTYQINPYRKIELDKFRINVQLASKKEIYKFTGSWPPGRIFHKLTNFRYNKKVFAQPYYHFYPDFFKLPSDIYLSGYFQSEKYFQSICHMLKDIYQPVRQLDERNDKLVDDMNKANSVSIHVRHGDHVTNSKYANMFGAVEFDFYLRAMRYLEERISQLKFYIFSDNPGWCSDQFGSRKNVRIIDYNKGEQSYLDLWLMSRCKHHIIANSTFSWWGAWLGHNPDKMVIAPKKWFRDPIQRGSKPVYYSRYYDKKDLIPNSWTTL